MCGGKPAALCFTFSISVPLVYLLNRGAAGALMQAGSVFLVTLPPVTRQMRAPASAGDQIETDESMDSHHHPSNTHVL